MCIRDRTTLFYTKAAQRIRANCFHPPNVIRARADICGFSKLLLRQERRRRLQARVPPKYLQQYSRPPTHSELRGVCPVVFLQNAVLNGRKRSAWLL